MIFLQILLLNSSLNLTLFLSSTNIFKDNYLDSLNELLNQKKSTLGKCLLANEIAQDHLVNNPTVSLEYSQMALKWAKSIDRKDLIAKSMLNVASSYYFQGDLVKDYDYLLQAKKVFEETSDSAGIILVLDYLSYIYESKGEINKQFNNLFTALKYHESHKDTVEIASMLSSGIGNAYLRYNNLDKALFYHLKALRLNEIKKDSIGLLFSYSFIGGIYGKLGKNEEAELYFKRAIYLCLRFKDNVRLTEIYLMKGEMSALNKDYSSAIILTNKALELSIKLNFLDFQRKSHEKLKEYYEALLDYPKAYYHLEMQNKIKDSLFSVEGFQKMQKLSLINETYEKQIETDKEIKRQNRRNLLEYSGVMIFCFVIFLTVYMSIRWKVSKKLLESLIVFGFLLFFEFILLVLDPLISNKFGSDPIYILIFNVIVALLLLPIHRGLEDLIKNRWLARPKRSN